jgi:hypothetical protein
MQFSGASYRSEDQVVLWVKCPDRGARRLGCCHSPQFVYCVQIYQESEDRRPYVIREVICVLGSNISIQ